MAMIKDHRAFATGVGRLIRAARRKRGLSAHQCAAALGLYSRANFLRYEAGGALPSAARIYEIALALNVPVADLLPEVGGVVRAKKEAPRPGQGLSVSRRASLRAIAKRVPEFWTGAVFRLDEVYPPLPRGRNHDWERVRRLSDIGLLIYKGQQKYHLVPRLQVVGAGRVGNNAA